MAIPLDGRVCFYRLNPKLISRKCIPIHRTKTQPTVIIGTTPKVLRTLAHKLSKYTRAISPVPDPVVYLSSPAAPKLAEKTEPPI